MKVWIANHPNIWEFILFNVLSNVSTVVNFGMMWFCTGFVFSSLQDTPFHFLFFNYTNVERNLGLCGFLSFLISTACAQTVNLYVQKKFVFQSDTTFSKAVPKYIGLAILLVVISAALPAYSQMALSSAGISRNLVPTLANVVNIVVQVVISYPVMKFWIMPKEKK